MITLTEDSILKWAETRKMLPEQVLSELEVKDGYVSVSYEELSELSAKLSVLPSALLDDSRASDLDGGIKVGRKGEGFKRTSQRNGRNYYTYDHLVITNAYPTLMPLRVELHVNDDKDVVLNGGHDSTEIVYVTKGTVRMHWEYQNEKRPVDLNEGDSVYIHPGVSHSFMAIDGENAELIAINW